MRDFLIENGKGIKSLDAVAHLVEIHSLLMDGRILGALELLSAQDFIEEKTIARTVLKKAAQKVMPLDLLNAVLHQDSLLTLMNKSHLLSGLIGRALRVSRSASLDALSSALNATSLKNSKILISGIADHADVEMLLSLSDSHPDWYQRVVVERIDLCYAPAIWRSKLPLLEKIELFDMVRSRKGVDTQRLFEAILESQDTDLTSEVVRHLTREDLKPTLDWLGERDSTFVLRPQWISYLRQYQQEVLLWANIQKVTKPLVLLLASVLDLPNGPIPILSNKSVLEIGKVAGSLINERHDVAAFVYVTSCYLAESSAAEICSTSFEVLHAAIAQSRLSNRAWQILEKHLMPLPFEQWDGCEKLRRAVLHFHFLHHWPVEPLWRIVSENTDLFHDFIRTSKAYDLGKSFFAEVRDSGNIGILLVSKQQFKEIKRLLR